MLLRVQDTAKVMSENGYLLPESREVANLHAVTLETLTVLQTQIGLNWSHQF